MNILRGKNLADNMLQRVKTDISNELSKPPVLLVVSSDETNPYFKGIMKDAALCGVDAIHVSDPVLVPNWLDATTVNGIISLEKNYEPPVGLNLDGGYTIPCTAEAIMCMLHAYGIPISGQDVCVIGRSDRVGRPVAKLMLNEDATVTVMHSKTKDIRRHIEKADIVIACAGNAGFDESYQVSSEATVVDIGGDFKNPEKLGCKYLIPAIGGVGPLTRAFLMDHLFLKTFVYFCKGEK